MTNLPNLNQKDTYKERKAKVGNNFLTIYIENTLPILVTKDSYLNDANILVRSAAGEAINTAITGRQDDEANRFIGIATVTSPLTYNKVNLYYDTKWKDIIVVPNLDFYSLVNNGNYDVRAYRVGNNNSLTGKSGMYMLGTEEANRVQLPEAQAVTKTNCLLTSLPGFHSSSFLDTTRFEELVDNKINILHSDRSLTTFINLGAGSGLFKSAGTLPVYLLSQTTFRDYGIESVGLQNISKLNLYLSFRF